MSESTAPAALWANSSKRALDCARDHLERLGYRVLPRQFRDCDLIAGRWLLVIACEVQARRIIEPVDDERSGRRKRLRQSASIWLARYRSRPDAKERGNPKAWAGRGGGNLESSRRQALAASAPFSRSPLSSPVGSAQPERR